MRRRRRRSLYARRRRDPLGTFAREWRRFELAPETRRNVFALLWFLLGVLSLLSLFGAAGKVGAAWKPKLFTWFGWGAYVLPFLVAVVALTRLDPDRFPFSRARYAGLLLVIAAGLGLLHLPAAPAESLVFVDQGKGGGYLGWTVSYWLRQAIGGPAAILALTVFFLAGLVLVSNRTPGQFFSWARRRRAERAREQLLEEAAGRATGTLLRPPGSAGQDGPQPTGETEPAVGAGEEETPEDEAPAEEAAGPALPVFSLRSLDGITPGTPLRHGFAGRGRHRTKLPPYTPPPLTLLSDASSRPVSTDIKATQAVIQRTLETFGIAVEMGEVSVGPTVTQYTLKPAEGVKLSKIVGLHNDLALALAAHPIRIEAPIPGKGLVGIEVPNKAVAIVRLREILGSEVFRAARSPLTFALGKDVSGAPVVADLERMPHLLLAGATGSGKSVQINALLLSLLSRNGPATLKLILIDPKRVELPLYNGIPHLLSPVIIETEKTISPLRWAVAEMDRRYELLSTSGRRDITTYNQDRRADEYLPRIVIVIDELADIMARHAREVENAVVRLAQIARAVGIHLVLATQRPSVDVITGLIKANITSRIAFKVASAVDARTILDAAGAEKLLGSGDLLYLASDHTKPRRLQGAYVSEEEVRRVVSYLLRLGEAEYDEAVTDAGEPTTGIPLEGEDDSVDEALFNDAKRVVVEARRASTSLLQRRLRIGYARAARIMDLLEEKGIIGPPDGARPREVLVADAGNQKSEAGTEHADFRPPTSDIRSDTDTQHQPTQHSPDEDGR